MTTMMRGFVRTCLLACLALAASTTIGRSQITIPATIDDWDVTITISGDGSVDVDPFYVDPFVDDESYDLPDWLIPDSLKASVPIPDPLSSEDPQGLGFAIGLAIAEALVEWAGEELANWWNGLPPAAQNLILQGIVLALT
jgi:hypothetical protein